MKLNTLCAAALLGLASVAAQAASYGDNLIVNGDAEAGTSGWTLFDDYDFIQAVSYGDNWVRPSEPGPQDRGGRMFTGLGARAVAWQQLDLGALAGSGGRYSLSGWLGGWLAQEDNAKLYVSFLDAEGLEIGATEIGPVGPAERANTTGLFYREASGSLPVATSSLQFWLSMERLGGGDNDGYADNLSFVISAVPEPQSWVLLGLGLAGLAAWRRRPLRG